MMSRKPYHSASHCKYLIQYHIIWCPKFRFSVLHGKADMTLKQILQKICEDYGYRIKALEVMPDHIHIFVDVPQTVDVYKRQEDTRDGKVYEGGQTVLAAAPIDSIPVFKKIA